ncbi:hypothetical protein BD310DRAFT_998025, partial [Dichomitus squalens]
SVVFLYDSIITTGEEIQCFWGRKITGAAILFWLNKYMTVLCLIWNLVTALNISDKYYNHLRSRSCSLSVRGDDIILYLLFIIPAAFTTIRVYALRRSFTLCALTAVLSLAPLGINFFADFGLGISGKNIPPFGCTQIGNVSIDLSQKFTIITRSCLIAADCLAIGVTWSTLGLQYSPRERGMLKGSISSVLLTDGTIYFLSLALLNCLHLAFTLLSISVDALQPISVVSVFTTPLSALLESRFFLHLQSASLQAVGSIPSSQNSSLHLDRSLVFERVVGSLAASIAPENYYREDFDDGDYVERAEEPTQTSRE